LAGLGTGRCRRPGERDGADPDVIAAAPGLTAMQAKVAALLARGMSVHEIVVAQGLIETPSEFPQTSPMLGMRESTQSA